MYPLPFTCEGLLECSFLYFFVRCEIFCAEVMGRILLVCLAFYLEENNLQIEFTWGKKLSV